MIGKTIAVVHLIIALFYSFYAFIIPPIFFYDYCYFVFLIVLQISWIFFNHECPLSYFYKAIHYKNYVCGDTTTLDDFNELTGTSENKYGNIADIFLTIILIMSIMIVGHRSKIANLFVVFILFIVLRFFYQLLNSAIGWNVEKFIGKEKYIRFKKWYKINHIEKLRSPINKTIVIIMILFFAHIAYHNRKRLNIKM
jgi:hypothetical protein